MSHRWNIINQTYKNLDGYKRVAWPPVSEERIIREFTPQPQSQTPIPVAEQPQQQQQNVQPSTNLGQQANQQLPAEHPQARIYDNVQPTDNHHNPHQYQNQPTTQPIYQQQYRPQLSKQESPQPIQYTQSQYNRGAPNYAHQPGGNRPYPEYLSPQPQPQQPQQPQQYPQPQYRAPYLNNEVYLESTDQQNTGGWKHIRPPAAKNQSQYNTSADNQLHYNTAYPNSELQTDYQKQQYRAPSLVNQQPPQQYQSPLQNQSHYQHHQHQQEQQKQVVEQYYQQQQQQPGLIQQQQQQPPQNQYQPQYHPEINQPSSNYQSQLPQHQQQQHQQYHNPEPQANYNSNSQHSQQPQQQQQFGSQDQPDYQQYPQDYRGSSPGIITLRKETPLNQKPAPVFISQPAAVNYKGGSNMRGDLKWPPPEYKEAAAEENAERRKLALGPVCRPRKVNRDYTSFFAKNALNNHYPSYKVPPGTQHMYS